MNQLFAFPLAMQIGSAVTFLCFLAHAATAVLQIYVFMYFTLHINLQSPNAIDKLATVNLVVFYVSRLFLYCFTGQKIKDAVCKIDYKINHKYLIFHWFSQER
jgi:hypothetical protein